VFKLLFCSVVLVAIGFFAFQSASAPRSAVPTPVAAAAATSAPMPVAAPTAAAGDVVVELDEATLTSQANARLAGQSMGSTPFGPATLQDVKVALRGGQMVMTGSARVGGASAPLSLTSSVAVSGGRPAVSLSQATLSGLALPDAARASLERNLQSQLDQAVADRAVKVKAVTIDSGKLRIVGSRA
jgi:hypothetical protein